MHFVVFLPGRTGANPQHLTDVGLPELKDSAEFVDLDPRGFISAISAGQPGVLVFWRKCPDMRALADWNWHGAEEHAAFGESSKGRFWIGWDAAEPPNTEDLARDKRYPGHWVTLGDGQQWQIPSYIRLDHVYRMGPDGAPVMRPAPQWERFCRRSIEIQKSLFDAVGLSHLLDGRPMEADNPSTELKAVTVSGGLQYAADALSINYRINLEIALALGLFTTAVLPEVVAATVDLPEILATYGEKKNVDSLEIPVT